MSTTASQKLSVIEKIGYSLGDLAANLIFQTLVTFLAFFYTDVYKIPAGKASFIITFFGFAGAFFNVIMGIILTEQIHAGENIVHGFCGQPFPLALFLFSHSVHQISMSPVKLFMLQLLISF